MHPSRAEKTRRPCLVVIRRCTGPRGKFTFEDRLACSNSQAVPVLVVVPVLVASPSLAVSPVLVASLVLGVWPPVVPVSSWLWLFVGGCGASVRIRC